jgi:hypothetical protein
MHPNSLANLRPAKKGEVRNPRGANGWEKLRAGARDQIAVDAEELLAKLIELAKEGNVQALRIVLGPILNVQRIEATGEDGAPISFVDLARRAREASQGGRDA